MILQKLLEKSNYTIIQGNLNVDINGISYDSRRVKSGDIFFCIKGLKKEGHKYANEAVKKGAKVIVCEEDIQLENKEITMMQSSALKEEYNKELEDQKLRKAEYEAGKTERKGA